MDEALKNELSIKVLNSVLTVIPILIAIIVCLIMIKVIMKIVRRTIEKSKLEKSLHTFVEKTIKVFLYFIVVLIIADMLSIPVTSLIATFSVVGLAFSLAIQDTLSNLASGVTILVTHPFKAGDYIDAAGTSGTVRDINFTHTVLRTPDNKVIHVPNKQVVDAIIVNYSEKTKRRVDITFNLSYDADAEKIKQIMHKAIDDNQMVMHDQDIFVRATAYQANGVDYTLRVWTKNENYWNVYFDLMDRLKKDFDDNKIEIPYNKLDVHIRNA